MGEIIVPIDLTQEEKEILAIFSKRQFFLVFPTGAVMLAFLLWGGIPFIPTWLDITLRILAFLVVNGITLALGYVRMQKYEQYLSEYVLTQWTFRRGQKVYY